MLKLAIVGALGALGAIGYAAYRYLDKNGKLPDFKELGDTLKPQAGSETVGPGRLPA